MGNVTRVENIKWHLRKDGYVCGEHILLARLITNARRGDEVDHINGNRLDNRKKNLRIVTRKQNAINVSAHKDSVLGVRGVQRIDDGRILSNQFRAQIYVRGKNIQIGYFRTLLGAKRARRAAEKKYFKEYRRVR
jgi:hypothetical protein